MAIKDFQRRLERMERRFLVQPIQANADSHAAMARDLYVSRLVLDAERETLRLLREMLQKSRDGAAWLGSPESIAASIGCHEDAFKARELEVAEGERRCAEAGLTEEDIARLAA